MLLSLRLVHVGAFAMLGEIALVASVGLMAWGLTGGWRARRTAAKRRSVYPIDDEPDLLPVRRAAPPKPPAAPSALESGPAPLIDFPRFADDRELEATLRWQIEYGDAFENVTTRIIDIQEIQVIDSIIYVNAWCHKRRDNRKFRLDRIRYFASVTTGEIHTDTVWFASKISGLNLFALTRTDGVVD